MEVCRLQSTELFKKRRYLGIIEIIVSYLEFPEKLNFLKINRNIENCVITKTRFIKVIS
jgi:hypothetical protein